MANINANVWEPLEATVCSELHAILLLQSTLYSKIFGSLLPKYSKALRYADFWQKSISVAQNSVYLEVI